VNYKTLWKLKAEEFKR